MDAVARRVLDVRRIDGNDGNLAKQGERMNAAGEAGFLAGEFADLRRGGFLSRCGGEGLGEQYARPRLGDHRVGARHSKRPWPSSSVHKGTARPMTALAGIGPK